MAGKNASPTLSVSQPGFSSQPVQPTPMPVSTAPASGKGGGAVNPGLYTPAYPAAINPSQLVSSGYNYTPVVSPPAPGQPVSPSYGPQQNLFTQNRYTPAYDAQMKAAAQLIAQKKWEDQVAMNEAGGQWQGSPG